MPRRITALLAVLAAAVTAAAASAAAGGESLASAAALPVGSLVTSAAPAHAGVQFWKIEVQKADMLVVDFNYVSGPLNDTGICLLPPETTEGTLEMTQCLSTVPNLHWTGGRGEVTYVAPATGTYYVAAGLADCLRGKAPDTVKPCTSESVPALAYQIGSELLHFTAVRIAVPAHPAAHRAIRVTGAVSGVTSGAVSGTLTAPRFEGRGVHATLAGDGTFAVTLAGLPRGRYRLKLEYPGDTSHRPAERVVAVSVR